MGECTSFENMKTSDHSVHAIERNVGFTDRLLLGIFTLKMSKGRISVSHYTFRFICNKLGSYLQRKNTHVREAISIESRDPISS